MELGLKGRTALISGGTKGIGRAIVETLLAEGAAVSLCARTENDVEKAVTALEGDDRQVSGRAVDVSDGAALKDWVKDAARRHGGIDIVIANASALAIGSAVEQWRAMLEVDLLGTTRLIEAALPYLEKSDAAAVVAVASASGRDHGLPGAGAYAAGKAALINYTKGLARELAPKGIRVNAVSPGTIFFEGGIWDYIKRTEPDLYDTALTMNPMGRMGSPVEVARTVAFVASRAATFMSGANVLLDGASSTGPQY